MKRFFLILAALQSFTLADEAAMNRALNQWKQEMAQYEAAVKFAKSDEARARVIAPDGYETGRKLFDAITDYQGKRTEVVRGKSREVLAYGYDKEWASPAVIWLLSHPLVLRRVVPEQKLNLVAKALVDSVNRVHFRDPNVGQLCALLASSSNVDFYKILEKIFTRNTSNRTKAQAAMGMAIMLEKPSVRTSQGGLKIADAKRAYYIKQALTLAPLNTMFGLEPLEYAAQDQLHRLTKLSVGSTPPQIKVADVQGKSYYVPQSYRPFMLFFWGKDEPNGIEIMKRMGQLSEKYPDLHIIPIVEGVQAQEVPSIMAQLQIPITTYLDTDGSAFKEYRVKQYPCVALIGADSKLVYLGYPDMNFQASLEKWYQKHQKEQAQLNAASQPTPSSPEASGTTDSAPPLREIPQF